MKKKKTLFMETTKIIPGRTVAQIQQVLGENGAEKILTEYLGGEIVAISFSITINGKEIPFRLPCRWEAIFDIFKLRFDYDISEEKIFTITQQAKRVAWRQLLRWTEAQLALVNTNMVKLQEVFMPYMWIDISGKTLYQKIETEKFKMLGNK